jgi:hypothetical protein
MGTDLTGPIEIKGEGVFPTDSLFDTVENYRFDCRYAEGITMIVAGPFKDGVRFEGSEGWVYVSHRELDAQPKSILESVIGTDEIHLYKSNDHKGNFLDCIRTRSEAASPAKIAQRSVSVGHLGLIAIRLGRKLKWNPDKEIFVNDSEADRLLSRPMRSPWHL